MAARITKLLVLAALALAVTASGGSAASPARAPILGVVSHLDQPASTAHVLSKAIRPAAPTTLSFDASYESLINRYFTDVAHDSGGNQNVYSVATQYYENPGAVHIQYQSTFAGSYVAHDPLPANGCSDPKGLETYCLTDQQLQDEIQTVLTAKGWQGGLNHMFFLLTPNGVGSCVDGFSGECSTNFFCAYHSAFGPSVDDPIIYANEPYEGPLPGCVGSDQGFPNDTDSDTTINTISHEHNEAITDPLGSGWIASDEEEDGDLCAYIYGDPLGGTGAGAYNQIINGQHYDLQEEYSNAGHGCKQRESGTVSPPNVAEDLPYNDGPVMHTNTTYAIYWLPVPGSASPPAVTGTAAVKHTLTTSAGAWNGGPTGYSYQWQRCSSAGTSCVDIAGATARMYKLKTADGGHTVRSTVRAGNANGPSQPAVSAATALVLGPPSARKAPHVSGRARVGKKLSGGHGSWSNSPKSYRYQWLRCNGSGGACSSIKHATHSTYKVTKHDAKHRLRVRVTAVNAAGSKSAVSRASARVPSA